MRPACVYLDLGNVLFWFDRDRAFRQMAAVSGTSPAAVRRVVMEDGLQASLECGRIDWEEFHREFCRRTASTSDSAALALAASDMFRLNAALLPVIAGLVRCRVALGVLSNTCAPHWRQLVGGDYAVLREGLRHVVLSHEAGCAKPDPAIYRLATERAGVPPERIFFTDDLPEHVAAARAAGWDAEVFVSATDLARALARRGLNVGL